MHFEGPSGVPQIIELVAKLIKEEKIKMVSEAKKLVDKYVSGDIEFTT